VLLRWQHDREKLQPIHGRQPYPHTDDEQRRVARDAYVSWRGSRYSVPWQFAGKDVWVREQTNGVEVRHGSERIALHAPAIRRHQVVTHAPHHHGIPLGSARTGKTLVHLQQGAPIVEQRSLAAYEALAMAGAR
jgi:hypothetical protein